MSRVSTHWRTHKRTNGITVVTFARVEYSAAADADWVAVVQPTSVLQGWDELGLLDRALPVSRSPLLVSPR